MAKNRPGTLGIIELVAAADDTPLRRTLQDDERLVRDSAARMQGVLATTTVGTTATISGMESSAVSTVQAFSLMGAQMSAVGGIAGATIGRFTAFGGALAGIGKAAFGLPGLLLLVSGAVTVLISKFIEQRQAIKQAREEFEAFVKSITEGQRKLEQTTAGLRFRAQKLGAEVAGDPIELRRVAGRETIAQIRFQMSELDRESAELEEKLQGIQFFRSPEARGLQARVDELLEQGVQLNRIRIGEEAKLQRDLEKIRDDARQKELDAEKKLAEEIGEERKKAFAEFTASRLAAFKGIGAAILGPVGLAIKDVIQETLQERQLEAAVARLPAIFDPLVKKLRAKLGLPAEEEARPPRIFGVRAAGFPDLAALSGAGGQAPSELVQLARARGKHLEKIDKTLVRIDQKRRGLN